MIFVTVGTHGQRFDRLLEALEDLPNAGEVVVQYGVGAPPEGVGEAVAFMSFEEIGKYLEEADSVISHAGVGSILRAREVGHTPVVVPRLANLGEHVDDHQVELTEALFEMGAVVPVWPGEDLSAAVRRIPPRATVEGGEARRALAVEVRRALDRQR